MPKVTFLPDDLVVEAPEGTTLFAAAIEADAELESQCGGRGGCALCRVKIVQGDVSPMEWEEQNHLGTVYHVTQERLACQTRIQGEVVVEIPVPVERVKRAYVPHKFRRNAQQALLARLAAQEIEVDSQRTVRGRARRRRQGSPVSAGDSRETQPVAARSGSERAVSGAGAARDERGTGPRDGGRPQAEAGQPPAGGKRRRRRRRKPRRRKSGGQGGAPGDGPAGGGGQGGPQPT